MAIDELQARLLATHDITASLGLMHKMLARLGLTREKKIAPARRRRAAGRPARQHLDGPIPQGPPPPGSGEQAFAKLKALMRKAPERTVDGPWTKIGQLLNLFPPPECAKYLINSGYPGSA